MQAFSHRETQIEVLIPLSLNMQLSVFERQEATALAHGLLTQITYRHFDTKLRKVLCPSSYQSSLINLFLCLSA